MTSSVSTLVEFFNQRTVLEPGQLEQLLREAPGVGDAKTLVRSLVQRKWLSTFQANQILLGRGKALQLGPYLLVEVLGEGGAGQVFKARHQAAARMVALKIIRRQLVTDKEVVKRFQREIEIARQLSSPHVVHALDGGAIGDVYFLAMELIDGVDLAKLVQQRGALAPAEACEYVRQAAVGLQHVHERGLVHRDVKPPNLFLSRPGPEETGPGTIKILDLGLARVQHNADVTDNTSLVTVMGGLIGTPDYMAPEQALDFHAADIRADVYSLGCTLFFLLTGRPPFGGGSLPQKIMRHQNVEPPALDQLRSDVPAGLAAVVRRTLAKHPRDRFQTPGELAEALASGSLASAATVVAVSAASPRRRRRRVPWLWHGAAAAGVVGLLGVTILGLALRSRPSPKLPDNAENQPVPSAATPIVKTSQAAAELRALMARWDSAGANREQLRPRLIELQRTFPGTGEARQARRLLRQLPSPLDRLDGKSIAAARKEGWPSPGPDLVALLGEPRKAMPNGGVAFSPDGRWLALATTTGNLRLWNVERDLIKGSDGAVLPTQRRPLHLLFTPDGQTLVVFGGPEATLTLWDVSAERPQQRAVLTGHSMAVRAAAVTPDGKLLASAGSEGTVRLWDLTQRDPPGRLLDGPTDRILALACSPARNLLAALGGEGNLRLWELDRRPIRCQTVDAPAGPVSMLAFGSDGTSLVAASNTHVRRYQVSGTEPRSLWVQKFGTVMSVAACPEGQAVVGTVGNGRLIVFDPATGTHRRAWKLPFTTHSIDFAPDGRHLAISCPGDAVAIVRLTGLLK